jgi:hypothetical protein
MKNLGENADREKIHTGQRTHLMKILYSPKPRFFVRDINTIARLLESTNHPTRNLRWDFVHQLLVLIGLELEKHVDVILQTEFVQSARDLIQESSRFFLKIKTKRHTISLQAITAVYRVLLLIATASAKDTQREIVQTNFLGFDELSTFIKDMLNSASSEFRMANKDTITELQDMMDGLSVAIAQKTTNPEEMMALAL